MKLDKLDKITSFSPNKYFSYVLHNLNKNLISPVNVSETFHENFINLASLPKQELVIEQTVDPQLNHKVEELQCK